MVKLSERISEQRVILYTWRYETGKDIFSGTCFECGEIDCDCGVTKDTPKPILDNDIFDDDFGELPKPKATPIEEMLKNPVQV